MPACSRTRAGPRAPCASISTVATNHDSPLSACVTRSGDTNTTLPGSSGVVRASNAARRTSAAASFAHVVDVLRPDARFDDELLAARARCRGAARAGRSLRRRRTRAAPSPRRRRAHARTDARPGRCDGRSRSSISRILADGLLELVGGLAAGTGCAPARCAPAARPRAGARARDRCGSRRCGRGSRPRVALQREQRACAARSPARASCSLICELLGGELRGHLGRRRSAARARRACACASRICAVQRGDLLVERAPARGEQRALARDVLGRLGVVERPAAPRSAARARLRPRRAPADALGAASWSCSRLSSASLRTSPITTSGSPARTRWPSRTRISRTMPPSWCCTVLRLSSTLTCAGATTAPDSGAVSRPEPAERERRRASGASDRSVCAAQRNARSRLGVSVAVSSAGERGSRRRCSCQGLRGGAAPTAASALRAAGTGRKRGRTARRRAERLERAVLQHRELVELRRSSTGDGRP